MVDERSFLPDADLSIILSGIRDSRPPLPAVETTFGG